MPPQSPTNLAETTSPSRDIHTASRARHAGWRDLLPAHRLPVIAKTPLLVAFGWYLAGGRRADAPLFTTLLLSAGLWATLYVLNEATDLAREQGFIIRKRARALLLALCVAFCLSAFALSPALGLLFALMTLGQVAYCVPPLRWKRHWAANVVLSGIVNPVLRLQCGVIWGVSALPPLVYAVCIAAHLGACLRARALLRARDERLGYRPGPGFCEPLGKAFNALAIVGGFALCIHPTVPRGFFLFMILSTITSLYAWSSRNANLVVLRRIWMIFAVVALVALALLLRSR